MEHLACHNQPPIRFKATIHEHSIDFLDTTIYKDPKYPNSLLTKVYFKPTDIHQLLDKTSDGPFLICYSQNNAAAPMPISGKHYSYIHTAFFYMFNQFRYT